MDNTDFLEELNTLTTCQEALAELLGAVPEGICSVAARKANRYAKSINASPPCAGFFVFQKTN